MAEITHKESPVLAAYRPHHFKAHGLRQKIWRVFQPLWIFVAILIIFLWIIGQVLIFPFRKRESPWPPAGGSMQPPA